jgi:hypothetical protein
MSHDTHTIEDTHRGQALVQPFAIEDVDGNATDLTGASIWFYVLESASDNVHEGSDSAHLTKTDGNGITVTDASNGKLEVDIDSSDWSDIPGYSNPYELWVKDSDGDQTITVSGTIEVDKRS